MSERVRVGSCVKLPDGVADIYRGVAKLEARFPGRPFTPDGHLVGSIGEVIAAAAFGDGFKLVAPSTKSYDAVCTVRGKVQVKLIGSHRREIALNEPCDHLVVFQICDPPKKGDPPTHAKLVYDAPSTGLFESLQGRQGKQRTISLKKLNEWRRGREAVEPDAYLQDFCRTVEQAELEELDAPSVT